MCGGPQRTKYGKLKFKSATLSHQYSLQIPNPQINANQSMPPIFPIINKTLKHL